MIKDTLKKTASPMITTRSPMRRRTTLDNVGALTPA